MFLIKAAAVQAASILFDTPETVENVAQLMREAAGMGADLVVFPQAFVGGCSKGLDFGTRLESRSAEGHEDFRRCFDSSVDLREPEAIRVGEIARDNDVYLVVGIIERDGDTLLARPDAFRFAVDTRPKTAVALEAAPHPVSAHELASRSQQGESSACSA